MDEFSTTAGINTVKSTASLGKAVFYGLSHHTVNDDNVHVCVRQRGMERYEDKTNAWHAKGTIDGTGGASFGAARRGEGVKEGDSPVPVCRNTLSSLYYRERQRESQDREGEREMC